MTRARALGILLFSFSEAKFLSDTPGRAPGVFVGRKGGYGVEPFLFSGLDMDMSNDIKQTHSLNSRVEHDWGSSTAEVLLCVTGGT